MEIKIDGLRFVEDNEVSNEQQQDFSTSILFGKLYKIVNIISTTSLMVGLCVFIGGLTNREPIFGFGLAMIILSIFGYVSAIFLRGYKIIIRAAEMIIQCIGAREDTKMLDKGAKHNDN